jgi:N6-adenosine-specific RNA methylase IME4
MPGSSMVAALDAVGWVLDPDRSARAPGASHVPRPAFHLAQPFIRARGDESAQAGGSVAARERKRQRKWATHPDATDQDLAACLAAAYRALLDLPSSRRFFGLETEAGTRPPLAGGRECCAAVQVPVEATQVPFTQHAGMSAAGARGHTADEDPAIAGGRDLLDPRKEWKVRSGRLVVCAGQTSARCVCEDQTYIVPPSSAFFLGDAAQGLSRLLGEQYDYPIVVLDPPWPSKSRGKYYRSMTVEDLCALPVGELLHQGGVLALWVTNDPRLVKAARTQILESWGLEYCATWYWLKVSCSGELCSPLESPHKKPFEHIIIARQRASISRCPLSRTDAAGEGEDGIRERQVIVAQPAQHSRKPFLEPLLRPMVLPAPHGEVSEVGGDRPVRIFGRGLEIFAREMHEGWTSLGDECLLFQNDQHQQPG